MYQEHFRLREAPFSLTPDPEYYFNFKSHQEALNVLIVALENGEGIIKIIGEVGTGKTLLCRKTINSLPEKYKVFYIPNPLLEPVALYQSLTEALGIRIFLNMTMLDMTNNITEVLTALCKEGKRFVICIDEAQAMPRESLEALRLLSNLETEKQKLLQILLFAQPELDKVLDGNDLRQIRQRITFSYYLKALDRSAVAAYINYRLYVAGYTGGSLFDDAAIEAIYRSSRGIPRLINILCHKAMMSAYGKGMMAVGLPEVMLASSDTEDATPLTRFNPANIPSYYYTLGVFVLLGIAIVLIRLWSGS
jgi:MSHA biogenesis protein MshM